MESTNLPSNTQGALIFPITRPGSDHIGHINDGTVILELRIITIKNSLPEGLRGIRLWHQGTPYNFDLFLGMCVVKCCEKNYKSKYGLKYQPPTLVFDFMCVKASCFNFFDMITNFPLALY